MELIHFIDSLIFNLESLKKTLQNKNNGGFDEFDKTMKIIFNDINNDTRQITNKDSVKIANDVEVDVTNLEKIRGRILYLEEEVNRMAQIVSSLYKQLYKTNLQFDQNIRNYYNLVKDNIRKPVDIGGNNFITLLNVNDINDIIDDFTFYYVKNINEVVVRVTNNHSNKHLYFNFKLEKIHLNEHKHKTVELTRLDNCRYGSICNNGNNCKFYHNPIEFKDKYHKTRNFYPNFSIKNCPNFGDIDLVKNQSMDWIDLQNTIQRAGFTMLAAACCKIIFTS
jgi:hypothetical protein